MYDEAIILEVKRNYAIAMKSGGEICRINLKDGIKIGDSVYILPEDIYKENKNAVLSPTALPIGEIKNKPLRKNIQRIAGLVAVFLICCTVFLFQQPFKVSACSVISFDSNGSIQLELDKDYNIIRATSVDGSVSQTVLDGLVGKNLKVIATELYNISGGEAVLIGYTSKDGPQCEELLRQNLDQIFNGRNAVILSGQTDDLNAAEQKGLSLGAYLAGKLMTEDELEDTLDKMNLDQLVQILNKNPKWIEVPEFKEALKDKKEELIDDKDNESDKDVPEDDSNDNEDIDSPEKPEPPDPAEPDQDKNSPESSAPSDDTDSKGDKTDTSNSDGTDDNNDDSDESDDDDKAPNNLISDDKNKKPHNTPTSEENEQEESDIEDSEED